ncbi:MULTISPECIES: GntR family transcriptional regulator [Streptomyces]|uniref:GntR family transcriptional regulator n=1 Tax=Streptomyces TaxID=1883 RepID=UPI000D517C5E|nr:MULTISPECIES: GntR family transcriptional regulator [Streptomyces]PVC68898.1 transcriptional regulator [Streptomyces sp. CS065A]
MSEKVNPRGTFLQIAEALRAQISDDQAMKTLPRLADVMRDNQVSRGVALRAFAILRAEGIAEPVPGGRWRVVRPGRQEEGRRIALADRIIEVFSKDDLRVGQLFPSTAELSARFGVSRPTVSKALHKLESVGLLSEARQGKQRTVRALPKRTESPES